MYRNCCCLPMAFWYSNQGWVLQRTFLAKLKPSKICGRYRFKPLNTTNIVTDVTLELIYTTSVIFHAVLLIAFRVVKTHNFLHFVEKVVILCGIIPSLSRSADFLLYDWIVLIGLRCDIKFKKFFNVLMEHVSLDNHCWGYYPGPLGPVSISDKTSYRKISWSLEAAILGV